VGDPGSDDAVTRARRDNVDADTQTIVIGNSLVNGRFMSRR
jgi:hypothetical protein